MNLASLSIGIESPTEDNPAPCSLHPEWFVSQDVEDEDGELVDETWPYLAEAKALCSDCPFKQWCRQNYWDLRGVVVAGKPRPQKRSKHV